MPSRLIELAAIVLIFLLPSAAKTDPVRVGIIDYPPYSVLRSDGGISGSIPDTIRVAFAAMDRKVEFEILPLARILSATEAGRLDAAFAARPAQQDRLLLSDHPVAMLRPAFFVRADSGWHYHGPASLRGRTVATVSGYDYRTIDAAYQAFLDSDPSVITISPSHDYLDRIARMLDADRIDLFNEDESAMSYRLSRLGLKQDLRIAGYLSPPTALHVAFRPDAAGESLRKTFDQGFAIARTAGAIAYINSVYGLLQDK